MGSVFSVLSDVFSKGKYVAVGLLVAFGFYLLNGFVISFGEVSGFYTMFGFLEAIGKSLIISLDYSRRVLPETVLGIAILSFLVGALGSVLVYRYDYFGKLSGKKAGFFGAVGVLLGAAAPGCAACGVGLISLLGFGSALAILPFGGKEVLALAILFTSISVYNISKKISNPVCDLNVH